MHTIVTAGSSSDVFLRKCFLRVNWKLRLVYVTQTSLSACLFTAGGTRRALGPLLNNWKATFLANRQTESCAIVWFQVMLGKSHIVIWALFITVMWQELHYYLFPIALIDHKIKSTSLVSIKNRTCWTFVLEDQVHISSQHLQLCSQDTIITLFPDLMCHSRCNTGGITTVKHASVSFQCISQMKISSYNYYWLHKVYKSRKPRSTKYVMFIVTSLWSLTFTVQNDDALCLHQIWVKDT